MSILESLKPNAGSRTAPKRVGRGRGSGLGQTSGKGHKGQLARTGGKVRRGFEGGQSPLIRRLPKFGFKCPSRISYEVVNLTALDQLDGVITIEALLNAGIVKGTHAKVLANGKVTKALTLKGIRVSTGARTAIEAAGGKIEV